MSIQFESGYLGQNKTLPQISRDATSSNSGGSSGQSRGHALLTASKKPIYSGTIEIEETQYVYSDSYGIKRTRYLRSGLAKFHLRSFKRNGLHVHQINKRTATYHIYLTPDNQLLETLVELQVH